jgi:ribosomal protein L24
MALSLSDGTRVTIVRGDHKGKIGTVRMEGKSKVVILDSGVKLMGVSDENTRRL